MKKRPNRKATHMMQLRLDDVEHEMLGDLAAEAGMLMTTVVRQLIRKEWKRKTK